MTFSEDIDRIVKESNSFDNNFNTLVDKLDLNKEWNKIFNSYKELSKEFGRHAGNNDNFISSFNQISLLYITNRCLN